jgi:1-acyl-sn-glycerol-3-phosphate acyltransferase
MTSPVDSIYLAAIFDPIFTASYPSTRLVQQVSLFNAIVRPFCKPELVPPANTNLVDLDTILRKNPGRSVVVFPECTTSNGQGILTLCPSLLTTPAGIKIFPISIRYTPPDITCPIPGTYVSFLWKLLSKPKHTIRVRVAEPIFNTPPAAPLPSQSYGENYLDKLQKEKGITGAFKASEGEGNLTEAEKKVLDKTQAALARLGRVQRLGLGVKEKMEFIMALSGERIC